MAYGMSSAELARVGQNVNRQSGGVSDQSIAEAMDKELSEERKEAVGRFQARKRSAVKEDAKQKAKLRSNLVKAVVKSGIKAAGAAQEAGVFSKKPEAPEIAPVAVKTGMKDNLTTGKPQPRLKLSGPTRKGPDVRSEAYAKKAAKDFRQIKRLGRRSKGTGTAEIDPELQDILTIPEL